MEGAMKIQPASIRESESFEELQDQVLDFYGVRATSRYLWLTKPRMRTHVLEAGRGEPILIVHGGDGEAVDWAPLIAVLQDHFHIFAVDRPGFGLTDRFDYNDIQFREHAGDFMTSVLDALSLERATLIGGSFGGFFCFCTALDHPHRVRRLILVGVPLGVSRSASLMLRLLCGVPGAARLLMWRAATLQGQRGQYEHEFHIDPDTVPELYFRMRVAGVRRPGAQETFAGALRRIAGLRGIAPEIYLGDELARFDHPTLFIWGAKDDMAPVEDGRAVSDQMPDSTFVVLDGVGHFPFLEAPEQTGALIRDFLNRADRIGLGGEPVPGIA
jgi:pimeloyl-ACP methyl ester carboxylesterase